MVEGVITAAMKQETLELPQSSSSSPSNNNPFAEINDGDFSDKNKKSELKSLNFYGGNEVQEPPTLVEINDGNVSDVISAGKRPRALSPVEDDKKKPKLESDGTNEEEEVIPCSVVVPVGFFDPLQPWEREVANTTCNTASSDLSMSLVTVRSCKQFWKAGDYEPDNVGESFSHPGGLDHARIHPKFLHSNATSHKWSLGAFAELLDNAVDEVCNGATYVNVDMLINTKDQNKMLLVQDNGGGMTPDKMRQCMSLGYSAKSKLSNTIGQYGNGFKTSTMRLGADVIVFSLCQGKNGECPTRSIGMMSFTFLRGTGKEDIVVPMVDYEKKGDVWTKLLRSSFDDWNMNLDTIIRWSPYSSEEDLLQQFDSVDNQGTRIIIYNLWEDDLGQLELDFDTDPKDIQIRGVNRDEKKIAMARKYPNSKHFLTYQHSLRSYASILYLRLPPGFRIILRGKDIEHHSLVDDIIHKRQHSYRPQRNGGLVQEPNLHALVALGFVKDAEDHIDIQGFNVYHKNRLIKPFWRVWNAAGSDGRGVIGVLEANFIEPAHDKQGFERTTALSRLEARLVHLQKNYWRDNCHQIGYAPRRSTLKQSGSSRTFNGKTTDDFFGEWSNRGMPCREAGGDHSSEEEMTSNHLESPLPENQIHTPHMVKTQKINADVKLKGENLELIRLHDASGSSVNVLLQDLQFERDRCKSLEAQLEAANKKLSDMDKEHEARIQIFNEERKRRDAEEDNLRRRLVAASEVIQQLLDKYQPSGTSLPSCKTERN